VPSPAVVISIMFSQCPDAENLISEAMAEVVRLHIMGRVAKKHHWVEIAGLTNAMITGRAYMFLEAENLVFRDIILPHCPDPFWRYVSTREYMYEELVKGDSLICVKITKSFGDQNIKVTDLNWTEVTNETDFAIENKGCYVIDVDGLYDDIMEARG